MKTYDERSHDVAEKMNKLKKQRKTRNRILTGTCLILAVVLIGCLFIPYDTDPASVDQHARNPYFKVIQKVNALTYSPPRYSNAFQSILGSLSSLTGGLKMEISDAPAMNGGAAMQPVAGAPEEYVEVTDNQVQGVIEADIFKRSDRHIFYLHGAELRIYSIEGEASKEIACYTMEGFNGQNEKEDSADYGYVNTAEMYLSADCQTLTMVINCYTKATGSATLIRNLDVSDPANVRPLEDVYFPGSYISSRMVDGKLLLTYNYRIQSNNVDFDEPETFVPSYGKPGDMTCIAPEDIVCPDTASSIQYTVVGIMDSRSLEVEGTAALMSYSQELYVSGNALYATHSYSQKTETQDGYSTNAMTQITGIAYGDGLKILGSIDLAGNVKDQYAMDEYENVLRVVTNTSVSSFREYREYGTAGVSAMGTKRNVDLYCIDLDNWELISIVEAFAPEGERAESVRFDGTTGYVCTAEVVTLTDPVYFFDLSDPKNITYTDTGTIDGYSSSLIQLGDGFLMGIGVGDEWQLKIEVYEEHQDQVVSVDAWEENANFGTVYKSYLIDREQDLVGLAVQSWETGECAYLLLHFDGYKLNVLQRVKLEGCDLNTTRACLIDDCIYILTDGGLTVNKIW